MVRINFIDLIIDKVTQESLLEITYYHRSLFQENILYYFFYVIFVS